MGFLLRERSRAIARFLCPDVGRFDKYGPPCEGCAAEKIGAAEWRADTYRLHKRCSSAADGALQRALKPHGAKLSELHRELRCVAALIARRAIVEKFKGTITRGEDPSPEMFKEWVGEGMRVLAPIIEALFDADSTTMPPLPTHLWMPRSWGVTDTTKKRLETASGVKFVYDAQSGAITIKGAAEYHHALAAYSQGREMILERNGVTLLEGMESPLETEVREAVGVAMRTALSSGILR